jgi:hypothetical protein
MDANEVRSIRAARERQMSAAADGAPGEAIWRWIFSLARLRAPKSKRIAPRRQKRRKWPITRRSGERAPVRA